MQARPPRLLLLELRGAGLHLHMLRLLLLLRRHGYKDFLGAVLGWMGGVPRRSTTGRSPL